jgi:hypothetical protein
VSDLFLQGWTRYLAMHYVTTDVRSILGRFQRKSLVTIEGHRPNCFFLNASRSSFVLYVFPVFARYLLFSVWLASVFLK